MSQSILFDLQIFLKVTEGRSVEKVMKKQLLGITIKLQKLFVSPVVKALLPLSGCLEGSWKMVPRSLLFQVHAPAERVP